jgi:hypothetical protein
VDCSDLLIVVLMQGVELEAFLDSEADSMPDLVLIPFPDLKVGHKVVIVPSPFLPVLVFKVASPDYYMEPEEIFLRGQGGFMDS